MEIQRMTYTFIELAKDTLEHAGIPLSHVELWQKACELGLDKKLSSVGKTPWESMMSYKSKKRQEKGEKLHLYIFDILL